MGDYTTYLDQKLSFQDLTAQRKEQLKRISEIRSRDVLVYAADFDSPQAPGADLAIAYGDLVPIRDQLSNLDGSKIDVILETGGGSGEVAEDIVRILHEKYEEVGIIVPGWAKSAGTIIAMAGDEILMGSGSALGPIDAQMQWHGRVFSAEALIEGMKKIKEEVAASGGNLNRAYVPMIQALSPGELQSARNALDFAKELVKAWLVRYKFKSWTTHSSSNNPVTTAERENRAAEIATALCDHSRWLTHNRSIRIPDLEEMGLRITDYSKIADLGEAIEKYHTLLQMTFDGTSLYKIFETPESQILRFVTPGGGAPQIPQQQALQSVNIDVTCPKCDEALSVQADLVEDVPAIDGKIPYPKDDKLKCPKCAFEMDLTNARQQLEAQTKKRVIR